MMHYLSVCSGIEAATVAWHPFGWTPFAFAEIEPFPAAVLKHHYPNTPNLGDMSKFKDWPDADIDVLVGGTPCQSFSVAGLRKGLDDPRGNLALVYLAIADHYRPEWLVWENVPGVLSSSEGRDFGSFIGGLEQLGYHAAWRVLDAQYVRVDGFARAVPQRRRRVFVVGHLGDWRRAAAVLFERESLLGHPAPRRQAGEGIAPTISSRPTGGGGLGTDFDCDGGLMAVAFDITGTGPGVVNGGTETDVHTALRSRAPGHSEGSTTTVVKQGWAVRRLTPLECERLQGFPDGYTLVPYRGRPAADGPRYKALGNSMAVNCMRWIGRRIEMVNAITSQQRDGE